MSETSAAGTSAAGPTSSAAEVEVEVIGAALGAHPGSELVGRVRAAGEAAQHLLGQVVLMPRFLPCGECGACRRLRIALCPTLHRQPPRPQRLVTLPARFLVPLAPPFLTQPPPATALWQYAALSDGLLSPYAGLMSAGANPGTLAVILGGGARAGLAAVAARAVGLQVAMLTPDADERERLTQAPYGALATFDPVAHDAESLIAALIALADGAGLPSHGITVIESSGSDAGRARALSLTCRGGTAILLDRAQPLDAALATLPTLAADLAAGPILNSVAALDRLVAEGCQLVGAGPAHPDLLPELLALCERAGIDLGQLCRPLPPSEIEATMAARRRGEGDNLRLPIVCYDDGSAAA